MAGLEKLSSQNLKKIDDGLGQMVSLLGAQEIPPQLILSPEVNQPEEQVKNKVGRKKKVETLKASRGSEKQTFFKGITGNILVLGLVSFLTDFSSEMIYPLLPVFLTAVLGAGPAVLGVIEGIAESTASLLKLVSGIMSDRVADRKRLVLSAMEFPPLPVRLLPLPPDRWRYCLSALPIGSAKVSGPLPAMP